MHVRRKDIKRMKENCLNRLAKYVLIAALLPLCWAALNATGGTKQQGTTLVLGIKPPPFPIVVEQPGCLASPQFNLYNSAGALVGQAVACVTSVSTNSNRFAVRTTTAHYVFDLSTGQIEADLTIWESTVTGFPANKSGSTDILQTVSGTIKGGNGVFAGVTGTIRGGGTITLTAGTQVWNVSYVFDMKF